MIEQVRTSHRFSAGAVALALLVSSGCSDRLEHPEPGVSRELAESRVRQVSDLRYDVTFDIPADRAQPVTGVVTASFMLDDASRPLVLDFRAPPTNVGRVLLDGESVEHRVVTDHIVIPAKALVTGKRSITVEFESTEAALNRQDDFLYALFVPDRASTTFPVFEQPDLKARFAVTLVIPAAWKAIANGALVSRDSSAGARHTVRFGETEPLSTYLMTFAAGLMFEESAEHDGRMITMYHRETDSTKVARNRAAIFDLHAASLRWLEEYTGIAYPFGKFAFFAVPAFQFGGMEHPGAIWYRSEGLFLDPTATRNQELGRASLIAHETAHMWFGDLVTMRWFNDVWMKEVFANFMAAKIAGPSFPDINLDLRFFQAHHPSAYAVDRTAGTNPIRQELENQREAGSLYGAIIYQKAPIVMKQLETIVGEASLRDGLRLYLERFKYGNATWPDLIAILDDLSEEDLAEWSRVWVAEPGRPTISAEWGESTITVRQAGKFRWPQRLTLALAYGDSVVLLRGPMRGELLTITRQARLERPDFILAGADGLGYGRFVLDGASRAALLTRVGNLRDPIHRAVAWQTLWEEMLDGYIAPRALLDAAVAALAREPEELVSLQLLGLVRGVFWRFIDDAERREVAPVIETALWREFERAPTPGRKGAYFGALVHMTLTQDGLGRLERIWRKQEMPRGLPLSEQQYVELAEALALREVRGAGEILDEQERRITNPDRRARFRFVRPALSADVAVRDAMFRSFATVENRRRESWVLEAVGLMNHPLRAEAALPNLRASLDLVSEIQQTGDIFFPLRWLNAVLDGHQSVEAAQTVDRFLAEHPDYPPRLRGKVLQAADDLVRASRILGK